MRELLSIRALCAFVGRMTSSKQTCRQKKKYFEVTFTSMMRLKLVHNFRFALLRATSNSQCVYSGAKDANGNKA